MDFKGNAKKIKRDIPAVFLALKKRETPWYAKVFALLTVGYALSPVDLIPDFIPVLGYLDDILILPLLIAITVRMVPREVMEESRREAEEIWRDGRPKRWFYAIPIILIWILIFSFIVALILSKTG